MAPTGDPRFHALLKELGELHDKKQKDYGVETDPFANVRGSAEWGVRPWVGAMIRAEDKNKRLKKYARDGVLENESARDSFLDKAVYTLIALILHDEEMDEKGVRPAGILDVGMVPFASWDGKSGVMSFVKAKDVK